MGTSGGLQFKPLLKAGSDPVAQSSIQLALRNLWGWRLQLPWGPLSQPEFLTVQEKGVVVLFSLKSNFFWFLLYLVTHHYEDSDSAFSATALKIAESGCEVPLSCLLCRLNNSQLLQPLTVGGQVLHVLLLLGNLSWTRCNLSMPVLYWDPKVDTVLDAVLMSAL